MMATRRVFAAWLPSLAYMALIWFLSSQSRVIPLGDIPFKDKGIHFVEYGVLGFMNARALRHSAPAMSRLWLISWAWLLTSVWGVLDEIHQAYVPGRFSDWRDVLADCIGALMGALLYWGLSRRGRAADGR